MKSPLDEMLVISTAHLLQYRQLHTQQKQCSLSTNVAFTWGKYQNLTTKLVYAHAHTHTRPLVHSTKSNDGDVNSLESLSLFVLLLVLVWSSFLFLSLLLHWLTLTVCRRHCWHCLLFLCISIHIKYFGSCYIYFFSIIIWILLRNVKRQVTEYMQFLHSHSEVIKTKRGKNQIHTIWLSF